MPGQVFFFDYLEFSVTQRHGRVAGVFLFGCYASDYIIPYYAEGHDSYECAKAMLYVVETMSSAFGITKLFGFYSDSFAAYARLENVQELRTEYGFFLEMCGPHEQWLNGRGKKLMQLCKQRLSTVMSNLLGQVINGELMTKENYKEWGLMLGHCAVCVTLNHRPNSRHV